MAVNHGREGIVDRSFVEFKHLPHNFFLVHVILLALSLS